MVSSTSVAHAQARQTFVSAAGDDSNPCTAPLPCRTFAGALAATLPGGTITALGAGSYGPVTITNSLTLEGGGVAEILTEGTNAITIETPPTASVTLHGLTLDGLHLEGNGIVVSSFGSLQMSNLVIRNFAGNGIWYTGGTADPSAARAGGQVEAEPAPASSARALEGSVQPFGLNYNASKSNTGNITVEGCGGMAVALGTIGAPLSIPVIASFDSLTARANQGGGLLVSVNYDAARTTTLAVTVSHSLFVGNGSFGVGVLDTTVGTLPHAAVYVSESSFLANSGAGLVANGGGAAITMSLNQMHANGTNGFVAIKNGQIVSFGNNGSSGNGIADGAAKGQANE